VNNFFSLVALVREDADLHTRVAGVTSQFTWKHQDAHFRIAIRYFPRGARAPAATFETETFAFGQNRYIEMREVPAGTGMAAADGLIEVHPYAIDYTPEWPRSLEIWVHYYNDARTFDAASTCSVYRGRVQPIVTDTWQVFPAIVSDARVWPHLLVYNFNLKPVPGRVVLCAPSGRTVASADVVIGKRDYLGTALDELIPDLDALLAAEGGMAAVKLYTQYRVPAYVALEDRARRAFSSFEHFIPLYR
jgi:hypothetical protein